MKINGDVIVGVIAKFSDIFLLLVKFLPIAQPSPSVIQLFCENGQLVPFLSKSSLVWIQVQFMSSLWGDGWIHGGLILPARQLPPPLCSRHVCVGSLQHSGLPLQSRDTSQAVSVRAGGSRSVL